MSLFGGAGGMTDIKALGVHSMWGFSPSQDLIQGAPSKVGGCSNHSTGVTAEGALRVLVAQPGDIRHVLASISRRRRHSERHSAVQFVVAEQQVEVLARHLLLLQIVCDWELPIRQRATVFLEVFGNTLIQERTQRYVQSLGVDLVNLICNGVGALADFVDCSQLKYRERDALVDVFRSWNASVPYDVANLRDFRLRGHFGLRYDQRSGVVDWDYHARVKPAAPVIHHKLYREWRLSGLAFEFGDQRYDQPNRTLGTYAEGVMKKGKDKGLKKEIRGYWVDVVNGPFVPFGVHCDKTSPHASKLFEVQNAGTGVEQYRHHTVEVAIFNVLSFLWEIETGDPYAMTKAHDIYSGLGDDASDVGWAKAAGAQDESEADQNNASESKRRQQALQRAQSIVETLSDVDVSLCRGGVDSMLGKAAFAKSFDVVHLSGNSAHHLGNENFCSLLADRATIHVETGKFIVPLNPEQEGLLETKIREMAGERGFSEVPDQDDEQGSLTFQFART
mmetsp:Transcript_41785/g.82190  ORF Transcript_41785/g.82190 Transcript_41785/m.82190 type:complete len:505 (+) Transcript_41785:225-1739(+)